MSKRTTFAALLSLAAFGSVYGTASSLGSLTTGSVGAASAAITTCDSTGVGTAYGTAWDATDERFEVTSVTVTGVADACDGHTLSVSVTDAGDAQIGSGTLAIPTSADTTHVVTLGTAAPSAETAKVHVVISS